MLKKVIILMSGSGLVAALGYVALHYIPAVIPLKRMANMTNMNMSAAQLDANTNKSVAFPRFLEALTPEKTYIKSGQKMRIQYALPKGAQLDLEITECRRALIVEVFNCVPINHETIKITDKTIGAYTLRFEKGGFYRLGSTVTQSQSGAAPSFVRWQRN